MAYMKDSTGRRLDSFQAIAADELDERYTKAFVPLDRESNHPRARKPLDAPILAHADTSATSIYWPRLVSLAPAGGTGWDLDYSTDHEPVHANSGIFRAHREDGLLGPFADVGRYYRDDVWGLETETGARVWDFVNNDRWLLSHQQKAAQGAIGVQSTMLVELAPDLSNPVRKGIMLDVKSASEPGDGHTGYFTRFDIGGRTYGYSLYGGGDYGRWALWRSDDGRKWTVDPERVTAQTPLLRQFGAKVIGTPGAAASSTPAETSNIAWKAYVGYPVEWKGRIWWIGLVGPRSSGASVTQSRIACAPLRDDLLGIAEPPIDITPPAQAWEGDGIDYFGNIVESNGKFYGVYRAAGPQGGFGLLEIF